MDGSDGGDALPRTRKNTTIERMRSAATRRTQKVNPCQLEELDWTWVESSAKSMVLRVVVGSEAVVVFTCPWIEDRPPGVIDVSLTFKRCKGSYVMFSSGSKMRASPDPGLVIVPGTSGAAVVTFLFGKRSLSDVSDSVDILFIR